MSTRDILRIAYGIILTAAGVVSAIFTPIIAASRSGAVAINEVITWAVVIMMGLYSIDYIICGIVTMATYSTKNILPTKIFVQIGVILAAASLVLSATNGMVVSHLVIALIAGILIPEAYFVTLRNILTFR